MTTQTTNLKLIQPTVADIVNVSDISFNMITVDSFIGFMQVTTKETVSSPFTGLKVMDSTGALWIYVEGAWISLGGGGAGGALGRKAYATFTTNSSSTTGSEVMTNIKASFTSEANRRYWVEVSAQIESGGSDSIVSVSARLRWASGASVTTSDTNMSSRPFSVEDAGIGVSPELIDFYGVMEFVPNVVGQVTVGLTIETNNSNTINVKASSSNPSVIVVRDVGT